MDIAVKDALAAIEPGTDDADSPHGTFDVILSAPVKDRDGEVVRPDEWEPLPDHITFDIDHGMSVASTVGSGTPSIDEHGNLRVRGRYASTELAQNTRQLVNDKHIRHTSVAFLRKHGGKDGRVRRELLNGAFVAVPANTSALVLASKAVKEGRRNNASDATTIQAIHDHATTLGADCSGQSAKGIGAKVSDTPWSQFTAADYSNEQWRRACLIGPASPSDNKADYKLPVREPGGALNRSAVHAAAAALAGARGGVQASTEDKARAARTLVSLYRRELDEEPPESLSRMAGKSLREQLAQLDTKALPEVVRAVLTALGVIDPDDQPSEPADESADEQSADESADEDTDRAAVAVRARQIRAVHALATTE